MSEQLYKIRLPDGTIVYWTAEQIAASEQDFQLLLSTVQVEQLHKVILDDEPRKDEQICI